MWAGEQVTDIVEANDGGAEDAGRRPSPTAPVRDRLRDRLAEEALLALSSDWAFMVSKDSAAGYARDRANGHTARVAELAELLQAGRRDAAHRLVAGWAPAPFGHVDARQLARS